jgi:CDP-glucose 4,6-dehydratase
MNGDFWRGRKVLVTGATGIVGSWLVKDLLALKAEVVALVQDTDYKSELYRSGDLFRLTVVSGMLEDYWTLDRAINHHEIQTVLHLGAQTIVGTAHRAPLPTFEANIRGTYNLLEACRVHRDLVSGVVVASSDKAYGEQPNLPYTEDMPLGGQHPYDVSKSCTDLITQCYSQTYGLKVGIARCGNIYGGGDLNWTRIVPGTIRSLLLGERPILRSDGMFVRDYIYVKDAARAYIRLAERLDDPAVAGEAFNFSTESPVSVLEIVRTIQSLMRCQHLEPRILSSARGEIRAQYLSAAKARTLLGWTPEYGLGRGLSETINWYRAFANSTQETLAVSVL